MLLMAVRLEVKSLTDTNALFFLKPSLAAGLPLFCSQVYFPGSIQMLPLCDAGARVGGHPSIALFHSTAYGTKELPRSVT